MSSFGQQRSLLRVLSSLLDRAKTLLVEQAAEQRDVVVERVVGGTPGAVQNGEPEA